MATLRLCITSLGNEFAKIVGEMGIKLLHLEEALASESSDEEDMSSSIMLEEEDKQVGVEEPDVLPDKNNFPLLHSFFLTNHHSKMDALLAEIIKLHDCKTITYRKGREITVMGYFYLFQVIEAWTSIVSIFLNAMQ